MATRPVTSSCNSEHSVNKRGPSQNGELPSESYFIYYTVCRLIIVVNWIEKSSLPRVAKFSGFSGRLLQDFYFRVGNAAGY